MFSKICADGFSFHTFEMQKSITNAKYHILKNAIFLSARSTKARAFINSDGLIKCEVWSHVGITVFLHYNGDKPPHFRLVVNPQKIIDNNSYIGIFQYTPDNINAVKALIDEILSTLSSGFTFDAMTLSRIDLCVNVEFQNPITCDTYMRLIRKCNVPFPYKRSAFASSDPDYKTKNKHSFRASKNDVSVTIYDKVFQLKESRRLPEDIDLPNGLLRFEVSLARDPILSITRAYIYQSENTAILSYFGTRSHAIMRAFLVPFFPTGLYVKYNILRTTVKSLDIKEKIRKRMLFLLEKSSECSELSTAIDKLRNEYALSEKNVIYILGVFEKYGLSPISLPNTSLFEAIPGISTLLNFEDGPFPRQ